MAETVFFYIFATCLLFASVKVVTQRNPVHSALSLVAAFFFLAGIYVLLAAHLIAILQIMVYAGAVMVLFVFVIMLLNLKDEELGQPKRTVWKGIGLGSVVAAVATLAWRGLAPAYNEVMADNATVRLTDMAHHTMANQPAFGSLKAVAQAVYLNSVLPFELTSLLLLVAVVGAVVVAKGKI